MVSIYPSSSTPFAGPHHLTLIGPRKRVNTNESFEERYPNITASEQDGWIELGQDDYSRSFVRVLDIGGMVWEGGERYETVDEALAEAEAAIAAWLEENG